MSRGSYSRERPLDLNEHATTSPAQAQPVWHVSEGLSLFAGALRRPARHSHSHSVSVFLAGLYEDFALRVGDGATAPSRGPGPAGKWGRRRTERRDIRLTANLRGPRQRRLAVRGSGGSRRVRREVRSVDRSAYPARVARSPPRSRGVRSSGQCRGGGQSVRLAFSAPLHTGGGRSVPAISRLVPHARGDLRRTRRIEPHGCSPYGRFLRPASLFA